MEYRTRSNDLTWTNWLAGMAVGALAMYIADPSEGRRRRALLQDKVSSYSSKAQEMMEDRMRDARSRFSGLQSEAMKMMSSRQAKPIDNHVLEARVRSRVARAFPQLGEITVDADAGMVTLGGDIAAEDEGPVLSLVEAIPGVEAVRYGVSVHDEEDGDGMRSLLAGRSPLWMAGAVGVGLLAWYGLSRRQPLGLLAATGLGLMARGGGQRLRATAEQALQPTGQGFEAERMIDIQASPESVYDVWSRYENFPHFMSHVIEVRDLGNQRSHWVVQGPAGSEVEFDAQLTASDRPRRLAWQSEPGARVHSEGMVTLAPHGGGTRATVHMSWKPPAGALGQGIAVLTGADPETALDEDLQRMKHFIERGLPARAGSAGGGAVLH